MTCPHCGQYATAPGGAQPKAPRLIAELPAEPRPQQRGFRCPYCGHNEYEYFNEWTAGGVLLFIVLLLICFPLSIAAFAWTRARVYCNRCHLPVSA